MPDLEKILKKLEQQGLEIDSHASDRNRKMLNITRDTGEFFCVLVKALNAKHILEIGTSNGYSTLWFASALSAPDSRITTIEASETKISLARDNFVAAGLSSKISLIHSDAAEFFASCKTQYDILFLDAERKQYMGFIDEIENAIKPGGLLIVDNALSHPEELEEFISYINNSGRYTTTTASIGKGEFLAYKHTTE